MSLNPNDMNDSFVYKGEWFLPDMPENQLHGTLTYDAEKGSYLELMGSLEESKSVSSYSDSFNPIIILGKKTIGKEVTLYRCFRSRSKKNITTDLGTEEYSIIYTFIGAHFFKVTELKFNSVRATLNNLDEWLNISGFKKKFISKDNKMELKHKLPNTIEFDLDEKLKGRFKFIRNENYSYLKVIIKQLAQFVIECDEFEIKFEDILDLLSHFKNFLTIGTLEYSCLESIVFMNNNLKEKIKNKEYIKEIRLFYKNPPISKIGHSKQPREFLFTYKDIKGNFKKIIHKWYTNKTLLNIPVSLFIYNFYNIREFNENNFLNIIQAIETFHRQFRSNEVLTKERYRKKKEQILNTVDKKHRDWLKELLNFGNEPTLHMRIEGLIKEFSNKTVNRIIKDVDEFTKNTKNSRNYYIHYDKKMEKKALN